MIKLGLRGAPPVTAVAVRYMIAALVIFFIISLRKIRIPRNRNFLYLGLFLGVFQTAIPYVLVYWGEQYISSGLTAILFSTMPISVAIIARIMLHDPLTMRKITGILLSFAGVWIIFSDNLSFGGGDAIKGMAACLVSAFLASFSSVVVKKYAFKYDPFAVLLLPFAIGSLLVWGAAIPMERSNPADYDSFTWFTMLYLAIIGSVTAFAIFFWIIKRIDVTVLSYQTFIIPVLAVLIGWIFLDEIVTIRVAAGSASILAGIALATLRPNTQKMRV
jgi:putative membrane protein PagO